MENLFEFLMEMDRLKLVTRRAYVKDPDNKLWRNENSAEHSWHLAVAIMALKEELHLEFDLLKVIKMALIHDICEIGAGDTSIFDINRAKQTEKEADYISTLEQHSIRFASDIAILWQEYEAQITPESQWVKVVDRLLPFMMNLNTQGKTWLEQGVTKNQVLKVNQPIADRAPVLYAWLLEKVEYAVKEGWLISCDMNETKPG